MISTLLVGFGFSAQTFHLPFVRGLNGFEVSGVVSSRPEAVAEVLPDTPVFATLEDALAHGGFDLCIITTPNDLHYPQASLCLQAGCHVLVEKPFTLSAADAASLAAQAELSPGSIHVYHNRRFDGDFLTIRQLQESGRFGSIRRMVSRFDRFRPAPKNRWRENAGPGAGIFWDLGPHLIDQAIQLFGTPESVSANIAILRDGGQSDDCYDVTLFYPGLQVLVGSSPFQGDTTLRFDVQGTAGSYRKYGLDPQENQLKAGLPLNDDSFGVEDSSLQGKFCFETACDPIATERGNYVAFYEQLKRAIVHGEASPASAQSVIPVIQVIEAALQSQAQEKRVYL